MTTFLESLIGWVMEPFHFTQGHQKYNLSWVCMLENECESDIHENGMDSYVSRHGYAWRLSKSYRIINYLVYLILIILA